MTFWRMIFRRITDTGVWLLIAVLFSCSVYFTWDVQTRRGAWRSDDAASTIQSGAEVQLVQVIDGDEVSVSHATGTIAVRILGIKAFDPNLQDPGISSVGQACVEALTQMMRKGSIRVVFDALRFDKVGRLLAYLEIDGVDVGQRLVSEGLAMAYTRYPFSREATYVLAQEAAKRDRAGLWLNPKATQRAGALIQSWKAER